MPPSGAPSPGPAEGEPVVPESPKEKGKKPPPSPKGGKPDPKAAAEPAVEEKRPEPVDQNKAAELAEEAAKANTYGRARFPLAELLNPKLTVPVNLRADVEPVCRGKQQRKRGDASAGGALQVSSLFGEGARDLLASMTTPPQERVPGYMDHGSFVTLTLGLAQPLPPPVILPEQPESRVSTANSKQSRGSKSPRKSKSFASQKTEILTAGRYERYTRVVLVADHRNTTVMKRLLAVIAENNSRAAGVEGEQARRLASVELTGEQRCDPHLDILSGFVVMDGRARIVVIEGLRHGAIAKVNEVLGIGAKKNSKNYKVLYHPEVGFSERLYLDFNLSLKQIKLRQKTLEALMHRPGLYDQSRTEQEVAVALQGLMDMKRAERLHVLKETCSFPTAQSLLTIEMQYGDFVANEELDGGRPIDDTRSQASSKRPRSSSSSKKPIAVPQPTADDAFSDDDVESGHSSEHEEVKGQRKKLVMKAALDTKNRSFSATMKDRTGTQPECMLTRNMATLKGLSEENEKTNENDKTRWKRHVDTSFLEGMPVHAYSGQKLNSAELQKQALRAKMEKQEGDTLWTYSEDLNSGIFPMLDKEVTFENMLRQSEPVPGDLRDPFRYPQPRPSSEYVKPDRDVSESRKFELKSSGWVENEWQQKPSRGGIIPNAFTSRTLGPEEIPLRRPGLQEAPSAVREYPERVHEERGEQMQFLAKNAMCRMSPVEKYTRTMLDGEPTYRGINFEKRRVPKLLKGSSTMNVERPPVSLNFAEEYLEEPRDFRYPSQLSKNCARPLRTAGEQATQLPSPRHGSDGRGASSWPHGSLSSRTVKGQVLMSAMNKPPTLRREPTSARDKLMCTRDQQTLQPLTAR